MLHMDDLEGVTPDLDVLLNEVGMELTFLARKLKTLNLSTPMEVEDHFNKKLNSSTDVLL